MYVQVFVCMCVSNLVADLVVQLYAQRFEACGRHLSYYGDIVIGRNATKTWEGYEIL